MPRRYLFFLREYNDIDNIAPAIHFLLQAEPDAVADLIYYRGYLPDRDENIAHLRSSFGPRLREVHLVRVAEAYLDEVYGEGRKRFIIGRFLSDHERYTAEDRRVVIERALEGSGAVEPALGVFDQIRAPEISGITPVLQAMGIPLVALPVSPLVNVNTMRMDRFTDRSLSFGAESRGIGFMHDYSCFDRVVFTDDVYLTWLKRYFESEEQPFPLEGRAVTLGSLRFCPEWLPIRNTFQPPWEHAHDGPKLVFFLSNAKNNAFWDELQRTFTFLSHYPELKIAVKPHTRNMDFRLPDGCGNMTLVSHVPSSSLIDWADAVMVWGSSVAVEAFCRRKTVLYLRFLHANLSIFEHFQAGWILRCRDELKYALEDLIRDRTIRPYERANVDRLLRCVVQGSVDRPVPERYVEFLQSSCREVGPAETAPGGRSLAR